MRASICCRISRCGIDTLSPGIGPPSRRCRDEQSAEHRPAVERVPPLSGVADFARNTHSAGPEYLCWGLIH